MVDGRVVPLRSFRDPNPPEPANGSAGDAPSAPVVSIDFLEFSLGAGGDVLQFPVNMAATDAPPLFLVGPHDSAELVNYRYINGYYVVDRLIDVAELRIGEKPQTIVRITRTGDRG